MPPDYLTADDWLKKYRPRAYYECVFLLDENELKRLAQREGWDARYKLRDEPEVRTQTF